MAYVAEKIYGEGSSGGSGNFVVDLPTAATNDLFLVFVMFRDGSITGTPSGWTLEESQSLDNRLYCYTKVAGATPATSMTPTGSTNKNYSFISLVIKDAPTSSYKDVSATRTTSSTKDIKAPGVTTTTNNCLVFCVLTGQASAETPMAPAGWNFLFPNSQSSSFGTSCYTVKPSSGATGDIQFYAGGYTNRNPCGVTIAIKDNSGTINPYADTSSAANLPAVPVSIFGGGFGSGHLTTGTSAKDVSAATGDNSIPTINSISTDNGNIGLLGEPFDPNYISAYITEGSTNIMSVGVAELASSQNLTNEIIVQTFSSTGVMKDWDEPSFGLILGDGTNYRIWRYTANNTIPTPTKVQAPYLIDLSGGYEYEDIGTFSISTVDHVGVFYYSEAVNIRLYTTGLYKLQTLKMLGGSSSLPCDFNQAIEVTKTGFLNTIQNQSGQTTGQFFIAQSVQIGNGGTNSVYWDSDQQSVEYPSATDLTATFPRTQAQIASAALSFTIDAGASNTVNFSSQVFNMGDYHEWKYVSGGGSISAIVVLSLIHI